VGYQVGALRQTVPSRGRLHTGRRHHFIYVEASVQELIHELGDRDGGVDKATW